MRVLSVFVAAILAAFLFGSGVASADQLTGQTYQDAKGKISGWNGEAVIATVSGDQVDTDKCVVTSWQKSTFLDADGRNTRSNEFLLHLNCNNSVASPGNPGYSALSPEGVKAKKDQQSAASINKNPEFCQKSDDVAKWCENVCKRTGLCEI